MALERRNKQTEVGEFPDNWEVKLIGEISNPVRGASPRPAGDPKFFNGRYIPWLTVSSLTNLPVWKIYITETEACLTREGSFHSRTLESGTLIIANSGATLGIAKILSIKCCANDGIAALLEVDEEIDIEYLVYYINTKTKYLRDVVATGNGQPNLNTKLISLIKVPLPNAKSEQTAIARALSDMDSLIAQTEKLIEKKKAIKQGMMQELLKPQEGWVKRKLSEVGVCLRGVSYNPETDLQPNDSLKTYSLLRSNNILEGTLVFDSLQFVRRNRVKNHQIIGDSDIIICMANGSKSLVGKAAQARHIENQKFTFGAFMGCFRPFANVNPQYVFALFESKEYRNYIDLLLSGSSINNLNPSQVESIEFYFPNIKIQNEISGVIQDFRTDIALLRLKLEKLKDQKKAMMQSLLMGRIRII
jgi:type I restriction enzyme S subunit